jgi:hypothetical protein
MAFYENKGHQNFIDATTKELGLLTGGFSRGVALADFNNDGFVDLYVVNMFSSNKLYVNSGNDNNWITLQLVGTKSNRSGIGARVTVTTENGYSQTQMLFAGSSFLSSHSPWLTFGLAQAKKVNKIVIHWPSGLRQELHELNINQKHIIQEG